MAIKLGEECLRGDKKDLNFACNSSYSDLHVLVHLGCSNKTPLTEWLINSKYLFFIVLEARRSKIWWLVMISRLPRWLSGKESACQCRRCWFDSWIRKICLSRKWQPASEFLPGKFHGQRSLADYSPWGHKESDTTEHIHHSKEIFHEVGHIGHTQ